MTAKGGGRECPGRAGRGGGPGPGWSLGAGRPWWAGAASAVPPQPWKAHPQVPQPQGLPKVVGWTSQVWERGTGRCWRERRGRRVETTGRRCGEARGGDSLDGGRRHSPPSPLTGSGPPDARPRARPERAAGAKRKKNKFLQLEAFSAPPLGLNARNIWILYVFFAVVVKLTSQGEKEGRG